MVQEIYYSFFRFSRIESYKFVVLIGFLLFGGKIKPSEAFDTSTFDTLRLGDEITSDMLEQIKALQAILNQPISLGLLSRGNEGPAGPPGSPGNTGRRGSVGDQGPVGEKGSSGFEGRFGKTGSPGPPGEPGPGPPAVNYANYARDRGVNDQSYANKQQQNYNTDQSLSMPKTQVICEGKRLWFGCNHNERINISSAFWGRDDFITCSEDAPSNYSIRQYSLNNNDHVVTKIKGICDWRQSCEFYATRLFLDDVIDSQVYKYLRVVHECVPKGYDEGEHREIIGK